MKAARPQVQKQGKVVAEWDRHEGHWMVMYPDGKVEAWGDRRTVEARVKSWFWVHNDHSKIGIGLIEWRGDETSPR